MRKAEIDHELKWRKQTENWNYRLRFNFWKLEVLKLERQRPKIWNFWKLWKIGLRGDQSSWRKKDFLEHQYSIIIIVILKTLLHHYSNSKSLFETECSTDWTRGLKTFCQRWFILQSYRKSNRDKIFRCKNWWIGVLATSCLLEILIDTLLFDFNLWKNK